MIRHNVVSECSSFAHDVVTASTKSKSQPGSGLAILQVGSLVLGDPDGSMSSYGSTLHEQAVSTKRADFDCGATSVHSSSNLLSRAAKIF